MGYRYLFRPDQISVAVGGSGEAADDRVYVFDDETVVLAVNVALATTRPLLVYGAAGSGKSTLAPNVARVLRRRYLAHVVTSRTEPEDLLWRFDAVARLSDANAGMARTAEEYYQPGVLWTAFTGNRDVVLIDEIDKGDPDLPNGLLAPLDTFSFRGPDGDDVRAGDGRQPLVVITSNDERDLPRPFLRRCVVLRLRTPDKEHLLRVASAHLGGGYDEELASAVADRVLEEQEAAARRNEPAPSTAEFLDALRACMQLCIGPRSPEWRQLTTAALVKSPHGGDRAS